MPEIPAKISGDDEKSRSERVSWLSIADQATLFLEEREMEIVSISTKLLEQIRESAYRAGREDAARERDDQIRRAARRLVARIIANAHLLDVPFTDAPDRSPWTELKAEMYRLYGAVGIKVAVVDHQLGEDPDTPEGR